VPGSNVIAGLAKHATVSQGRNQPGPGLSSIQQREARLALFLLAWGIVQGCGCKAPRWHTNAVERETARGAMGWAESYFSLNY
jgi:hypothetical protein